MQVDYRWKEKAEELELKLAAAEDKNQQLQAKLHGTELLRVIGVSETGIERQRTLKEHNKRIAAEAKNIELQEQVENADHDLAAMQAALNDELNTRKELETEEKAWRKLADAWSSKIAKLQSQVDALNSPVLKSEWQEQQDRIEELEAQVDRTCKWKRQKLGTDWDEYDSWGTSCGEDFAIVEEWHDKITPYCSNCGGKVIEEQKL